MRSPSRSCRSAYREVSGPSNRWANARQIMYAARGEILRTHRQGQVRRLVLHATLLPDFIEGEPAADGRSGRSPSTIAATSLIRTPD